MRGLHDPDSSLALLGLAGSALFPERARAYVVHLDFHEISGQTADRDARPGVFLFPQLANIGRPSIGCRAQIHIIYKRSAIETFADDLLLAWAISPPTKKALALMGASTMVS